MERIVHDNLLIHNYGCFCLRKQTTGRQEISGVQFLLQQGDGQRWIVFASEPLTFLVVDDSRNVIQGSQPYTGVLRLAIIPPEASLSGSLVRRLMNHAGVYSTGGEVVTEYYDSSNGNKDTASIRFTFQTAGGGHVGNNNAGNAELLMLALPHHAKVLDCSSGSAKLLRGTAFDGTYRCIKGNMTAVVGNSWSYKETLTSITLKNDRTIVSTDMKNVIRKQVSRDINLIPPSARDIYGFGKEIARMAQLAHIAHALGHDTARDSALDTAQRYLLNFFSDDYEDSLVFDSDLGGIVSLNGVKDPMVDFGNGRYVKLLSPAMIATPTLLEVISSRLQL